MQCISICYGSGSGIADNGRFVARESRAFGLSLVIVEFQLSE